MYKMKIAYDRNHFKFEKSLPKGEYNAELRFTKLNESNKDIINEIIKLSGTWDEEDVESIDEIIKERKEFPSDR